MSRTAAADLLERWMQQAAGVNAANVLLASMLLTQYMIELFAETQAQVRGHISPELEQIRSDLKLWLTAANQYLDSKEQRNAS